MANSRIHNLGSRDQRPQRQAAADTAPAKRQFSSSGTEKEHHFDTFRLVSDLQAQGFTEPQSQSLMELFDDIINESYVSIGY